MKTKSFSIRTHNATIIITPHELENTVLLHIANPIRTQSTWFNLDELIEIRDMINNFLGWQRAKDKFIEKEKE